MLAMLIHSSNILKHASSMLNNVNSVLIHTTHIFVKKVHNLNDYYAVFAHAGKDGS